MGMSNGVRPIYDTAARTATPAAVDQPNQVFRGLHLVIDCTVKGGAAPSVVFTIVGKDPVSGKTWTILTSAAVVAVGTTILKVYPGITAAANASVSDALPPVWQVVATHANTDSITYSVVAQLIV